MSDYIVYCHIFPNGKRYIGITKTSVDKRWCNGNGYMTQSKIARAIKKYGWENVVHEVLAVGLDHDKANEMEQYYIAKYDTLNNGYNATIGGDNILSTYLDSYVLDMIRYVKKHCYDWNQTGAKLVYDDRHNKEASRFWNEAARAIQIKHGRLSTTDERSVAKFWCELDVYCSIYNMLQDGRDA